MNIKAGPQKNPHQRGSEAVFSQGTGLNDFAKPNRYPLTHPSQRVRPILLMAQRTSCDIYRRGRNIPHQTCENSHSGEVIR